MRPTVGTAGLPSTEVVVGVGLGILAVVLTPGVLLQDAALVVVEQFVIAPLQEQSEVLVQRASSSCGSISNGEVLHC